MAKPTLPMVECLICHIKKKALPGHLRSAHQMSTKQYRDAFGPDVDIGYVIPPGSGNSGRPKNPTPPKVEIGNPQESSINALSKKEQAEFERRFETLFKQIDYNEALRPDIRTLVHMELNISRYQAILNALTSNPKPSRTELIRIQSLQKVYSDLQSQKTGLMDKCNLTREKQQALKKIPETTPSRIITSLLLEWERMTPEMRLKEAEDEKDAMERLRAKRPMFDALLPPDAEAELIYDDTLESEDTQSGGVFSQGR